MTNRAACWCRTYLVSAVCTAQPPRSILCMTKSVQVRILCVTPLGATACGEHIQYYYPENLAFVTAFELQTRRRRCRGDSISPFTPPLGRVGRHACAPSVEITRPHLDILYKLPSSVQSGRRPLAADARVTSINGSSYSTRADHSVRGLKAHG